MKKFLIILAVLFTIGCTDAGIKNFTTYGSSGNVQLYSGGKLVGEWTSTGKIMSESCNDGWCFVDTETGKLIRVIGTTIITN